MTTNQNLYPTVITNPVKNSNTVVNAQSLTGGTLSSQFDLQSHRIVKGLFTPTAVGTYFVVDPITGAPIQLGEGDMITSLAIYGPAAAGGTSVRIGLSPVPTFSTAGVPTAPAAIATNLAAATVTADVTAGLNATVTFVNAVGATNQWLSAVTVGTYTAGSVGVVLGIYNPTAVLL